MIWLLLLIAYILGALGMWRYLRWAYRGVVFADPIEDLVLRARCGWAAVFWPLSGTSMLLQEAMRKVRR